MAAGRPQLARDRLARQDSKVGMGGEVYTLEKEERRQATRFMFKEGVPVLKGAFNAPPLPKYSQL